MLKRKDRSQLKTERFLALLTLLVLTGMLATAAWSMLDARRGARERAGREIENLASAFEQDTRRTIEIYDLALRQAVDAFGQPGFIDTPLPIRTRLFFSHVDVAPHLGGMYLIDAGGQVTLSSQSRDTIGMPLLDREYFRVHRASPDVGLYISPPLMNRVYHAQALHFSRRLNNQDGSFGGVAAGSLKVELFKAQYETVNLGSKTSSVALVWGRSQLVIGVPFENEAIGTDLRATEFVRA